MKVPFKKITVLLSLMFIAHSCNKQENSEASRDYANSKEQISEESVSDSISYAANQTIDGKKFIKTADLNMEVQDVYKSTIEIEKYLKNNGGFVTLSSLNSEIISDEIFNIDDAHAMLVRKYQTENSMEVRVPTEKLGDFLQYINDQKLFLRVRGIRAEDITANIQLAKLEENRTEKVGKEVENIKSGKEKVELTNGNEQEKNYRQINNLKMQDDLKYSSVHIYLKEPKVRVAEIAVTNTKNIDNKYKYNFLYDLKNALVEGFYLIQQIIIGLFTIWPLILIGILGTFLFRKYSLKNKVKFDHSDELKKQS